MSTGALALQVTGLRSAYGKSEVLSNIELEVRQGEIAVLLGRNGAGKTTTLRTIAGVQPARGGSVVLDGADVTRVTAYRRARAGLALVPQGGRSFGPLSVEDNLRLVRGRNGRAAKGWSLEQVYDFFPKLRVVRRSAGGSLSGGERQMLAIGRALRANPRVVMLDEPSEGLAPVIVQAITALLGELRQTGIAILLAEQNHQAAMRVADRCYFIEKGRIAHSATADEVRNSGLLARYLGV